MPAADPPLFIIAGPTAVGKSELAVRVAERCGGEIVSADAFQVYQGLDILTAKPDPALLARIPHHLIGAIPLTQTFDAAQYLELAQERIAEIRARQRAPIVVGGAGFYLRALTHGLPDIPSADTALRSQLESHSTPELAQQLAELDPECYARIDKGNRRRLVRALEVCLLTGRPFSSFRNRTTAPITPFEGIVLHRERQELYDRINRRTEAMFAHRVEEEVRAIHAISPTAGETLGLATIRACLQGNITREQCIQAIQQTSRHYAKRQLTWFRREPGWTWIDISQGTDLEAVVRELARRAQSTTAASGRDSTH